MRILIVGSGIAGLFNAYELCQKRHNITIVEKFSNLGGELQTVQYKFNEGTYFFDVGPHLPPDSPIWNNLCEKIESEKIQGTIRSILQFEKSELTYPFQASTLNIGSMLSIGKYAPYYLFSALYKKNGKNLEDSLINAWGKGFYKQVLKSYMETFLKSDPKNISNNYSPRFRPPQLKKTLISFSKSFFKSKKSPSFRDKLYPKYGCADLIHVIVDEIEQNGVQIKKNMTIEKLIHQDRSVKIVSKNSWGELEAETFDKVIWSAPISDLVKLLGLVEYDKFKYLNLLTINCAITKKYLLEHNAHCAYIMMPNIFFHRIYEPKKLSRFMAPESQTSVCIEVTLEDKPENFDPLIKKCLKQFRDIYSLSESQIKLLGYEYFENVYPHLFIDNKYYFDNLENELHRRFKNIFLIGRIGKYYPFGIRETLESVIKNEHLEI